MREYQPEPIAHDVLIRGKILAPDETPQQMFERVVNTLFDIECHFGTPQEEIDRMKDVFTGFMVDRAFSPGTPTLTNAGRSEYAHTALSSCVVIPVDLRDKEVAAKKIRSYYRQNMGSGFDFTPYADPVGLLHWVNNLSAKETATGLYDRYIGNMGSLHVTHPKIVEFIHAKRNTALRHFNISIDVNDEFMNAALKGEMFTLADETRINAKDVLDEMAQSAWLNGDPGIIFLERMNRDNPVEMVSAYTSTPPCSEMGLAPGETCQFGYINLAHFAKPSGVDYKKLAEATIIMTRALDNAIEVSMQGYPDAESRRLAELKRKIGIGVCGLADTLIIYGMTYDSEKARTLARDILSFINYSSKVASVALAETRGSCGAMDSLIGNKYYHGFLEERYGQTNTVTSQEWNALATHIKNTRNLRNILTTSLPPTGRASMLMGVVSGIEPLFSASFFNASTSQIIRSYIERYSDTPDKVLAQAIHDGSFQNKNIKNSHILKTATEISPLGHMKMVAALSGPNGVYDEAVSKTINLPQDATAEDILEIFTTTHELGLKNISVYRDGSHEHQPQKL